MSAVVVDSSSLVDFLLDEGRASDLARLFRTRTDRLCIPALCDVEVAAALRRSVLRRLMSHERAAALIDNYVDLPLERHSHEGLLSRAFELSANFSVYDATYVALAERLAAGLATSDRRLARAVAMHTRVNVIV